MYRAHDGLGGTFWKWTDKDERRFRHHPPKPRWKPPKGIAKRARRRQRA